MNNFKIALRSLAKNKAHTFINIAGLSVGLTCSLFIGLWVQSELSVDAYHANGNRLYKVYEREYYDHKVVGDYDTPAMMADELKRTMPEVEYAASMKDDNSVHTFSAAGKIIKLEGTFAGSDLFNMFNYPLLAGTAKTALSSLASIAISKKMAVMFFGDVQHAVGKAIKFDNRTNFLVTAVFDDLPENSSRKFEYVINWQAYLADHPGAKRWDNTGPLTFLMLKEGVDPRGFEKKLMHLMKHYRTENASFRSEDGIQRFDEVYLHSTFVNGIIEGGRIQYVNLFSIVAVFLMLIACVNFMNLTTAQSVKRSREIGVRKVVGAVRGVLIRQFIGESLFLTCLAVVASLFLMTLLLPLFNQITQKHISIPFNTAAFWLKLLVLTLVTSCVSGSYPALFLSSFNPIGVLKGTFKVGNGAVWFRKGLVVFQFVLSGVLIIATIIVSRQVKYIQSMNIGYDRENLVYIPVEGNLANKFAVFKDQASAIPGVASLSHISTSPTVIDDATTSIDWSKKEPGTTVSFAIAAIGYDFASTMKLNLLAGRDYTKDHPTDLKGYVINESTANKLGYPKPIGQIINVWGQKGPIIGVVRDFHFASLHDKILPLILYFNGANPATGAYLLVRVKAGQTREALAGLEQVCKQLNPQFPFTYYFSDEQYQQLYKSEQVVIKLSDIFAVLAIFVSCLGLLGLAMFTAEQRVKEIGIRKVLGASIGSLFALLSSEFLLLVFISLVIASPLAWYTMNRWLQGYTYHTPVQWWVFAFAGGAVITIALLTVSIQAIKAALVNPVKSLRSE